MMRLFRRVVLGGKSDKTEGTLLAFLIGVAWVTWIIERTAAGVDMGPVIDLASLYMLGTVAAFTGATITHHLRPPAPPTEPGQDWQGEAGGGEWSSETGYRSAPPPNGREVHPR